MKLAAIPVEHGDHWQTPGVNTSDKEGKWQGSRLQSRLALYLPCQRGVPFFNSVVQQSLHWQLA